MATPLTANFEVTAVELLCRYCQAPIPAPNGSLFWTVVELQVRLEAGKKTVICFECEREVLIPRQIPGL